MCVSLAQLWSTFHPPELVRPALERTLKTLGLDYVDLYIIEIPVAFKVSFTSSFSHFTLLFYLLLHKLK